MRRRDERAIAIFGTWMITGLYLDGWAHMHQRPETFFTPWHGVLYSGFAAAVAFFTLAGVRDRDRSARGPDDRLVAVGLVVFIGAAFADFGWHQLFGIEANINALLSPTHLALMIGGVLMVTGPLRSAWSRADERAPSFKDFLPTIVCTTIATMAVSFFLIYLSAFQFGGLFFDARPQGELQQAHAIASVLTTNLILLAPTVLVLKRWKAPFGSFTLMYTAVAFGVVAISRGIFNFPLLVVPGIVGGVMADVVARRGVRWVVTVVPAFMWFTWVLAVYASTGGNAEPEFIGGSITLAVLSGWAFSSIVFKALPVPTSAPIAAARVEQPVS